MSVLIKGMSFVPYNDEGFFNLRVSNGRPQAQYNDGYDKYTEWYDMIIVPEPHGRLIDADAFTKDECINCDGACEALPCDCLDCESDCRCDFIKDIGAAPTVIPASKEAK